MSTMQKVSILPLCSIYEIYFWLVGTGKKNVSPNSKRKKTKDKYPHNTISSIQKFFLYVVGEVKLSNQ